MLVDYSFNFIKITPRKSDGIIGSFILGFLTSVAWVPCYSAYLISLISLLVTTANPLYVSFNIIVYCLGFGLTILLLSYLISKINFAKPKTTAKQLRITIPESLDYEGVFDEILAKYTSDYSLVRVRTTDLGSLYELTYSVNMLKDANEKEFIDEIRCRNGNLNIILALAATEIYAK